MLLVFRFENSKFRVFKRPCMFTWLINTKALVANPIYKFVVDKFLLFKVVYYLNFFYFTYFNIQFFLEFETVSDGHTLLSIVELNKTLNSVVPTFFI